MPLFRPLLLATFLVFLTGVGETTESALPIPASPAIAEAVRQAEAAEKQKDWRSAAFYWQQVIAKGGADLHPAGPRHAVRARDLAATRLAAWPAGGIAAYEEMFGAQARDLAARFYAIGDVRALRTCIEEFPVSAAARGLLAPAALHHLEAGRLRAATALCERLRRDTPDPSPLARRVLEICRRLSSAGGGTPAEDPPLPLPRFDTPVLVTLPAALADPEAFAACAARGIIPSLPCSLLAAPGHPDLLWLVSPSRTEAVLTASGRSLWARTHGAPGRPLPWDPPAACLAGLTLVRPLDATLTALDPWTGKTIWTLGLGPDESIASAPAALDGSVLATSVVATGDEEETASFLLRVDTATGRLLARIPIARLFRAPLTPMGARAPPPLRAGRFLVAGDGLGTLAGIDLENATLLWTSSVDPLDDAAFARARVRGERWRTPFLRGVPDGSALLFASSGTDALHAVSTADGRPLWSVPRGKAEWVLCVADGAVWTAGRGMIRRLDTATGAPLAESALPEEAVGPGYLARDADAVCAIVPVRTGIVSVTPGGKARFLCRWPGAPPPCAVPAPRAALVGNALLLGQASGDPLSGVVRSLMRGDLAAAAQTLEATASAAAPGADAERISALAAHLARTAPEDPAAERLADLVVPAASRAELLLQLADARTTAGRPEEAAGLLDRLLAPGLRGETLRPHGIPVAAGEVARDRIARLLAPDRLLVLLGAPYEKARKQALAAPGLPERLEFFHRWPLMPESLPDLAATARRAAAAGNAQIAGEAWEILSAVPAWRAEALEGIARLAAVRGDHHAALHAWTERLRIPGPPPSPKERPLDPELLPWASLRGVPPPVDPLAPLWHLRTAEYAGAIDRTWTIGPLLCTAGDGALSRHDPRTGEALWRSPVGSPDSLFLTDGADGPGGNEKLFLASRGTELMRLDPATGRPLWLLAIPATGGDAEGPPAPVHPDRGRFLKFTADLPLPPPLRAVHAVDGTLVVQVDATRCVGIEAATGNFLWDRPWDAPVFHFPAGAGEKGEIRAASGRFLHRVDPANGISRSRAELPLPVSDARMLPGTPARAWMTGGGRAALVDVVRETPVREFETPQGPIRDLAFNLHETVAAGLSGSGAGRALAGIDAATGKLLWSRPVPGDDPVAWRFAQQDLLVARVEGRHLVACRIDERTGREVWRFPLGATARPLASPQIAISGMNAFLHDPTIPVVIRLDAATGERRQDLAAFGPGVRSLGFTDGVAVVHAERGLVAWGRPAAGDGDRALAPHPPGPRAALAERAGAWRTATDAWREALDAAPPADAQGIRNRMESARALAGRFDPPTIRALRFARPPAIDGRLDDGWAEEARADLAAADRLEELPRGAASPWQGTSDLSARLYLGWDDDFLYLALDADDQKGILYDEEKGFAHGDSLLVHIDPEGDRAFEPAGADRMVGLALQNPVFAPARKAERPPGRYAVAPRPGGGGSVYEAAIPWSWLRGRAGPATPAGPDRKPVLGIGLQLADDDGDGVARVLTLSPGMLLRPFAGPDAPPAVPLESPAPALFARLVLDD